jgi:hypothetical protein
MNHELVAAILTALLSSGGAVTLLGLVLSRRDKVKQEAADKENLKRDKQAEDSRNWYQESREHYKTAKEQAEEARRECSTCKEELRVTRNVIYLLLEELEDQILRMLMAPDADLTEVHKAIRVAVHKARDAL